MIVLVVKVLVFSGGDAGISFSHQSPRFLIPKTNSHHISHELFLLSAPSTETEPRPRCIMGVVGLSLIYIFFLLLSSSVFFWGNEFKPETQTFWIRIPGRKVSELLSRPSVGGRRRPSVFFLLISGIWGFLHRRFRNFLTVLFFYVTVLLSVLQLLFFFFFLVGVCGPLFTWWQWQFAAVRF